MESDFIIINILINNIKFIPTLIDSGCSCYAAIDKSLAVSMNLKRTKIKPRLLEGITGGPRPNINEVTCFDIDLDGHKRRMVYAYVIRDLGEPLILGRPWMNEDLVEIKPADGTLFIGTSGISVKSIETKPTIQLNIKGIGAPSYGALVRRARRTLPSAEFNTRVFAVTLADINKALKPKKKGDPKILLPRYFYKFLPLFDAEKAKKLPPHRPGIDHVFEIERDADGKEKTIPWGPLYNISKDKLLIF